jgi:hypothetical protein
MRRIYADHQRCFPGEHPIETRLRFDFLAIETDRL